jgi:hypothetical protein
LNRKLIKFYRTDHSVDIYTIQKGRRKSDMFVLLNQDMEKFFRDGYLATFDLGHVAQFTQRRGGDISAEIRWCDVMGGGKMTCSIEYLEFPPSTFDQAYSLQPEQSLYVLDRSDRPHHAKVILTGALGRVREVLNDKKTRRPFIKAVMGFQNRLRSDKVLFWPDYEERSFYWEEEIDGQRVMNGGLIWHGDRYGIHT